MKMCSPVKNGRTEIFPYRMKPEPSSAMYRVEYAGRVREGDVYVFTVDVSLDGSASDFTDPYLTIPIVYKGEEIEVYSDDALVIKLIPAGS